jgi:APA family basic amino acid/polyamine antiporter
METDTVGAQRRRLSLIDTISVIVGIVIGAGIYETPPLVFQNVGGVWSGLGVWALGGFLCLVGAFTYAELATTYPRSGGDYVYLTRAYGPWAGFLFGWAQLAVILTANIGMMAYIFGDYAAAFFNTGEESSFGYAVGAVVALTVLNVFGVAVGKVAQNILSAIKVVGLCGIVAAAVYLLASGAAGGNAENAVAGSPQTSGGSFAFAMVLVFLTYGGWNDAAFVVAEMRDSRRIAPALILGILAITAIYLAVNAAYIAALGFQGVRDSNAVAADVLTKAFDETGGQAMSALVMISALGAANGLIYTGSRLYATVGADYSIFSALGRWNPTLRSPVYALVAQAVISLLMIAAVGSASGQNALNEAFRWMGMEDLSWEGRGGFDSLLRCTAPIFWLFFLLTSLSLFLLRWKDPHIARPFTTPFYPLSPILFSATCGYMLYSGLNYAGRFGLVGAALLVIGLPLYFLSPRTTVATQP